jgi:hypothetical protein
MRIRGGRPGWLWRPERLNVTSMWDLYHVMWIHFLNTNHHSVIIDTVLDEHLKDDFRDSLQQCFTFCLRYWWLLVSTLCNHWYLLQKIFSALTHSISVTHPYALFHYIQYINEGIAERRIFAEVTWHVLLLMIHDQLMTSVSGHRAWTTSKQCVLYVSHWHWCYIVRHSNKSLMRGFGIHVGHCHLFKMKGPCPIKHSYPI